MEIDMKEISIRELETERVSFISLMGKNTRASGRMILKKGKEYFIL